MNALSKIAVLVCVSALAVVAGCGGTSDPSPTGPPVGGISGNGIAIGPISTFGSIVVNGVRYDTANATFTIDGNAATESDLKVGQIIVIRGTIDSDLANGTAGTVVIDDNVTGPIDSIDRALNQLVVLGQLVLVNADTSFDNNISPASLDGLTAGDIVEVSGFFTASGDIEATRIEMKPAGTQFEVHGTVSALDATNFLFSIGGLRIDYSSATLDDFQGSPIGDGDFVEAKGTEFRASGELIASSIELENVGINGDEGDHVEIEGLITRFVSETDFDVSGIAVTTDGGTVFEGGVAADLGLNIKVEVEGELNAAGILVADKVDIRRGKAVRSVAVVDSVDAAANSLVMLGITFTTDELTRFEDKSDADLRPLTINDISAGDYLEVRGTEFPAGSGQVQTTILERDDLDTRTILQGFVEAVGNSTLTILGVSIDTSGAIFRDLDDSIITAAEFFNLVGVGSLVKARGTETGDTMIAATEMELEFEQ